MAKTQPKAKKAVQAAFLVADTKKCGTQAQQVELDTLLSGMTQEELGGIKKLIQTMSSGACINGDGSLDPTTGQRTTGGYRKSVHYLKAWFGAHPNPVQLA